METPFQELGNDMIIAIDSTGMKVSSRGEWIRHKWKVKKGWIKVHVAVDFKTKKLLALEITDEKTGDGKMLKPLIKETKKNANGRKIKAAYADGAYDSRDNFNFLSNEGIEPVIKTRKNASTRARGSPARGEKGRSLDMKDGGINTDMDKDWQLKHSFQG